MKNKLAILMTVFILSACKNSGDSNLQNTDNEKLVEEYFGHFNNHDWTKMANMYTEVSEFKDPSLGNGIVKQTRQEIIDKYSKLSNTFPNLNDRILQTYSSGKNHIIVEFIASGSMYDSVKFELPICTIFTIENGLITKDFTYYDNF